MLLAHLTEDTRWLYRNQNALTLQITCAPAYSTVSSLSCALIAYCQLVQLREQLLQLIVFHPAVSLRTVAPK